MNEFLGLIKSYGIQRLAVILGVSVGVAIGLAMIVARLGVDDFGILYSDLEYADGQTVIDELQASNIDYRMREQNGSISILVPRDEISNLKLNLATQGISPSAGVGYEIFDEGDSFGATTFQQNIARLRALEGELARTVATIDGVKSARVHLVLPERQLFARQRDQASASVVIDAPRGINPGSIKAIVSLIASAVPELTPARVTVLDAAGVLLAGGGGDEDQIMGSADERVAATEFRMRRTVEDIVGRIVGTQNVRVQVTADLDFNRITENAEIIDPDSQTVLSSTLIEEAANESDPVGARGVSIANGLPGAQIVDPNTNPNSTSTNRRTEETTNYEISRTVRSEVRELGGVKRLSVAVALNRTAEPLSPEDLSQISALVKSAIGFDEARGDNVEIIEMPFSDPGQPLGTLAAAPAIQGIDGSRAAEIGALAAIGLALIFFVLRPMLNTDKSIGALTTSVGELKPLETQRGQTKTLAAPGESEFERRIDLAQVEGQVKASSLRKVVEVVQDNTDESAGILKNWIREAS